MLSKQIQREPCQPPNKQMQRARIGYKFVLPLTQRRVADLRRYARRALAGLAVAAVAVSIISGASAVGISGWTFGEGYTSQALGSPAEVYYRAFSLGNMQEICGSSPVPARFESSHDPIKLKIGARIERIGQVAQNRQGRLVVEAYSASGEFLPHVPIIVTVIDPQKIMGMVDGDYLEATNRGEAEFEMTWTCGLDNSEGVQSRVRIVVSD